MSNLREELKDMIRERIRILREKIAEYSLRASRSPKEVEILGATKGVPSKLIEIAFDNGIKVFGENRVQEAVQKIPLVERPVIWHMIGHLQTNKVKKALNLFSVIETLDREPLLLEIEKRAKQPIPCLIEVNTSSEPSKYGLEPDKVIPFFERVMRAPIVKPLGLMTLGPYPPEERRSRRAFSLLRELRDSLQKEFPVSLPILSMGMTEDFHWAILEGATEIRIGRGIFGERRGY